MTTKALLRRTLMAFPSGFADDRDNAKVLSPRCHFFPTKGARQHLGFFKGRELLGVLMALGCHSLPWAVS